MSIILEDPKDSKKIHRKNLRSAIGLGMVVGFLFFLILRWMMLPPTLGTVDVNKILQQFIQTQTHSSLSTSQLKKEVTFFSNALESTLQHVAQKNHVLLMPQAAVLAGGKDFTQIVVDDLRKQDPHFFECPRHHFQESLSPSRSSRAIQEEYPQLQEKTNAYPKENAINAFFRWVRNKVHRTDSKNNNNKKVTNSNERLTLKSIGAPR